MQPFAWAIPIGIGATLVMDCWTILLKRAFGIAPLNYAVVGRWLGGMPAGRFAHRNIGEAAPVAGEGIIGWVAHYAIGIVFAGLLVIVCGERWVRQPTLGPALVAGLCTVAAPFFLMQPAMGLGVAASRTPAPNVSRLRSIVTHLIFGTGLYISALLLTDITKMV